MKKKPIVVETTQKAPVVFTDVVRLVNDRDALGRLQTAYSEHLPAGKEPEFKIQSRPDSPGHYFYTNKKGIRTDVREVIRRVTGDQRVEVVFFVQSDRFFGPFSAVIVIEGQASGEDSSSCRAQVFALPERRTVRFFVRHLKLVELFFKSKTKEMRSIFTDVVQHACREPAA